MYVSTRFARQSWLSTVGCLAVLASCSWVIPVSVAVAKPPADSSSADGSGEETSTPTPERKGPTKRTVKSFTPDPNAIWVCEKSTVTMPPVWRAAVKSVDFAFEIRNDGTAPLQMRARGGCGTHYNGSAERTIEPGDTEHFVVMLSCPKLQGDFTREIKVETNDPSKSLLKLICKGKIMDAVRLDPKLVNFRRIFEGAEEPAQEKVFIMRGDGDPIAPTLLTSEDGDASAVLRTITEGERYELVVTAHPKPDSNKVRGRFALTTGVKDDPKIYINVYGTVVPRVSIRPAAFILPSTTRSYWKEAVELMWNDGERGRILSATTNNPKFEARFYNEKDHRRVEVALVDPLTDESLPEDLEVTVTTDDPKFAEAKIPIVYRDVTKMNRRVDPPRPKVPTAVLPMQPSGGNP